MEFGTPVSVALLALAGAAYAVVAVLIAIDVVGDAAVPRRVAAAWITGLVVLPYVVAIVYAIVRGRGMADRRAERRSRRAHRSTPTSASIDRATSG